MCPVMLPSGPDMPQASRAKSLQHRIARPVEVVGELEQLAGEVGTERARRARDDVEGIEVTQRVAVGGPGGLAGGVPVEVVLHRHAERIGRAQHPVQPHSGPLQLRGEAEDADAVAAHAPPRRSVP